MMPAVRQLLDFLDRSSIVSELENRGFKRTRLTWTQRDGGVARVVDFQRSRFSDPGTVHFTVNLGVALDRVRQIYTGAHLGQRIDEGSCFPSFRVGETPGGFHGQTGDVWWTISEGATPDRELAVRLKTELVAKWLPLLERLSSVDAVLRFAREELPPAQPRAPFNRITLAILHHLHGEVELAKSLLDELESNAKLGEDWRDRARRVRARLAGAGNSRE